MVSPSRSARQLASLAALFALLASAGSLALISGVTLAGSRVAGAGETHFLPIVQSRGYTTTVGAARTMGMEGFGYATIDLENWSDATNQLRIRLRPSFEQDVALSRSLGARAAHQIALKSEPDVRPGRYAATLAGSGLFGAVARTEWPSGAAAAYEAPELATKLILPLTVRDVYSHTSILYFQNSDESGPENKVDVEMFDNSSGELAVSFSTYIESGTTVSYDTWFDDLTFGDMPINAGDGGSLLAMRISAQKPLAIMAFGDEMAGQGTSAYTARPEAAANGTQYLPSVRANYLGHSQIAIANPSMSKAVDATITYRPHDVSSADPGVVQPLRIEARGAAFVDLASLNRGLPPPAGMVVGSRANQGFHGNAVISATGPVLAVAQEEARVGGVVRSLSAYNAFGPADLDVSLAVPRVYSGRSGRGTLLVVMNPNAEVATTAFAYRSVDGSPLGSVRVEIPAGGSEEVRPGASLPDVSQLEITSDRPIAVVVYETTLLAVADWGTWGLDAMCYQALRGSEALGPTPPAPTATRAAATSTPTRAPATQTGVASGTPTRMPTMTEAAGRPAIYLPYLNRPT